MNLKHDKETIIAKGQELFRERGYHDTGVNEILKSCQISKGVFYNYFSTKEDFCFRLLPTIHSIWMRLSSVLQWINLSHLFSVSAPCMNPLWTIAEAEDFQKGCLVYNLAFEVAGKNDIIARVLDHHFERWVDLVASCIEEGQQDGSVTKAHSAQHLASILHTSVNGAYGRVKAQRSIEPMKQIADTMLQMIAI